MIRRIKSLSFNELEELLEGIEKPGRYIDSEIGTKSKSLDYIKSNPGTILSCLIFPDTYEVGMSNLGLQILYNVINSYPFATAERAFAPWTDFEKKLRDNMVKLFSLENRIFLDDFDLIGFNAAHEMLYTNILNLLDLSGLEISSNKRHSIFPIICAGGSSTFNPWPLSKFMDFMVIGDGEETIAAIIGAIRDFKIANSPGGDKTGISPVCCEEEASLKQKLLFSISQLEGVFVPEFYKINYTPCGNVAGFDFKSPVKKTVRKATFRDFDDAVRADSPVIPNIQTVHDRLNIEIMRGCSRSCRFCQAGFIYRPVRQKNVERLVSESIEGLKKTGYDEISFTSLSSSDFKGIESLLKKVSSAEGFDKISISMPSLRMDSFTLDLAHLIQSGRKTGLTFAPEAGSQGLRDKIKKDLTESDLVDSISIAMHKGWDKIKLYFMIGLPFETEEDIYSILELIRKIVALARSTLTGRSIGRFMLNVSINAFIPKPFTPFQWCPQESIKNLEYKFGIIASGIPKRFVKLHWTNPQKSLIECALSRGDSRTSDVIEEAWRTGAKFDNWTDFFNFNTWVESFLKAGVDISFYTERRYGEEEILPWDIVDAGIKKSYFLREYKAAKGL